MTILTTSLTNIAVEFGDSLPVHFAEYYSDSAAGFTTWTANVPTSASVLSMASFQGISKDEREYPPAAMTSLSSNDIATGAYTFSSSSGSNLLNAFQNDGLTTTFSIGGYSATTGLYTSNTASTTVSGTAYNGEWIQMQSSTLLNYTKLTYQTLNTNNYAHPESFVLAGSSNGTTWSLIQSYSNVGMTGNGTVNTVYITPTVPLAYNYMRMIVTKVGSDAWSANRNVMSGGEMAFYGQPRYVLAYPPAAMTANSTTISSSFYGKGTYVAAGPNRDPPYQAFDRNLSLPATYYSGGYNVTNGLYVGSTYTTMSGSNYYGSVWDLTVPLPIYLTQYNYTSWTDVAKGPTAWVLGGTSDGVNYDLIDVHAQSNMPTTQTTFSTSTPNVVKPYTKFRIVVSVVGNSTYNNYRDIPAWAELSYLGYSAEKIKKSVVRPYPVAAMTSNSTVLSGYSYGNGTVVASVSTASEGSAYMVFDGLTSDHWTCDYTTTRYSKTTGAYSAGTPVQTTVSGAAVSGEWVQLQHPNAFVLVSYAVCGDPTYYGRNPSQWTVAGSTDGTTWTTVDAQTGVSWSGGAQVRTYVVTANIQPYAYYRIVVQAIMAGAAPQGAVGCTTVTYATLSGYEYV